MQQKEDINFETDGNPATGTNENETDVKNNTEENSSQENTAADFSAEIKEAQDKYLRLYSEFENYKKRMTRDRIEQSKMAGADMLLSFLPIIDDLERAIKAAEEKSSGDSVLEGIKLIYSKIKSITEAKGLKPMDAKGKPFDADFHDAIANVPAPNGEQKGNVIEEIEKGYFLNDKVIRHAKVIVGN